MKNEKKLLDAMQYADESFVREADPRLPVRKRGKFAWKGLLAACLCVALLVGTLVMVLPFSRTDPAKGEETNGLHTVYGDSPYYAVIEKLDGVKRERARRDAMYQVAMAIERIRYGFLYGNGTTAMDGEYFYDGVVDWAEELEKEPMPGAPIDSDDRNLTGNYVEITDIQVKGVVEADRIKRSDKAIYYLDHDTVRIYAIDGVEGTGNQLGSYQLYRGKRTPYSVSWEFFLSPDCTTLTVLTTYREEGQHYSALVSLDVSDPEQIREIGSFAITGGYLSARTVGDQILFATEYVFSLDDVDFDRPETFLPMIDTGSGPVTFPAELIEIPEEVYATRYTVVMQLDRKTLELKDALAHLSYTDDLYVTKDRIYLARVFSGEDTAEGYTHTTMTEISCLQYGDAHFKRLGSVTVRGYIKDQWSLDEYDGILRIVTTTNRLGSYHLNGSYTPVSGDVLQSAAGKSNASLYCVDANTWEMVAKVEDFAPDYEEVQSVRFDGTNAYVCTSVEMSDPVYFFDLSDLQHITYKDTGTIDGYSTSLINIGDGFLLGIGVGDWNTVKLEIYEETADGVRSVSAFTVPNASYARTYKSYLIDREHHYVGLGLDINDAGTCYLLLQFDGYELSEAARVTLGGEPEMMRGVVVDSCLYAFGWDCAAVTQLR